MPPQFRGFGKHPADTNVRHIIATASDENGGVPPIPNYKPTVDLQALLKEEQSRAAKRFDKVLPYDKIEWTERDGELAIVAPDVKEFAKPRKLNSMAQYHLSIKLGVPSGFFMRSSVDLRQRIIAEHDEPIRGQQGFFRVSHTGDVRAILSPTFAVMDNVAVLKATIGLFGKGDQKMTAAYLDIGETFLHGRILFPGFATEAADGEKMVPGVQIRNSEVGMSSLCWDAVIFRVKCWNGLIDTREGSGIKVRHAGKNSTDAFAGIDESIRKIVDTLPEHLKLIQTACEQKVENPQEYLELAASRHALPKAMIPTILEQLASTTPTKWEVINAATMIAHGKALDSRVAIETAAGKMLTALKA
jgi:Domain of unknown function (DUF932)